MRLTFEIDADGIQVRTRRRLDRVLPPSEPIDASRGRVGFRFEVHDRDGQVRYVRAIADPRPGEAEVPLGGPHDERFAHVPDPRRRVTSTAVVPDYGAGTEVVLVDLTADAVSGVAARAPSRAGEVARLALHEEG